MATRNANNTIAFGTDNFGAPISMYSIDGGADISAETNPGEAMEAFIETMQMKGTVIAIDTLCNPVSQYHPLKNVCLFCLRRVILVLYTSPFSVIHNIIIFMSTQMFLC